MDIFKDENAVIRQLFYKSLHIDEYYDWLRVFEGISSHNWFGEIEPCDQLSNLVVKGAATANISSLSDDFSQAFVIKQFAPLLLGHGSWMQYACNSSNSHQYLASYFAKVYSKYAGYADVNSHYGNIFGRVLACQAINLPDLGSAAFAKCKDISDESFVLPLWLQAVSNFPDRNKYVILGITLFFLINPPINDLKKFIKSDSKFSLPIEHSYFFDADASNIRNLFFTDEELFLCGLSGDQVNEARMLIQLGFSTCNKLYFDWIDFLNKVVSDNSNFCLAAQVAEIVSAKRIHACGYHKNIRVAGNSLDDRFTQRDFDSWRFVYELAESKYVSPGFPERSSFYLSITNPKGAMFRIFLEHEREIISDWIKSLPSQQFFSRAPLERSNNYVYLEKFISVIEEIANSKGLSDTDLKLLNSRSVRQLYYGLLNWESNYNILPIAKEFASKWLAITQFNMRLDSSSLPPFTSYSAESFDIWLNKKHADQVNFYSENRSVSREQLIESSLQLCPLVYIDGGWIQRSTNTLVSRTPIGSLLLSIFLDEVGNGNTDLNHPNVYRSLMDSMNIELPKFGTLDFALWDRFKTESFNLPAFWLSISVHPRHFFSQILGLNLAMELSGVGGGYKSSSDLLKRYGYSSQFVDLHNSIDNIASGHTAWARDAIKEYLDDVQMTGGKFAVDSEWQKIWVGYRALSLKTKSIDSIWNKLKVSLSSRAA